MSLAIAPAEDYATRMDWVLAFAPTATKQQPFGYTFHPTRANYPPLRVLFRYRRRGPRAAFTAGRPQAALRANG